MVRREVAEVTVSYALEYMEKVFLGEEEALNSPLVFAEGGTCYAFSCRGDLSKKDDWRADGYRWRHNGRTKIKSEGYIVQKTYYNAYSAPKTTTTEFRRLSHECYDYPGIVIIYYKGQHSLAGEFPHGNRRCDSKPYLRTRPSIIAACRSADGNPSTIFKDMVDSCGPADTAESLISVPRNALQISNLKKYMRRKRKIAEDAISRLHDISFDAEYTYEIITDPDLIVAAYQEPQLESFRTTFDKLPPNSAQFISFNTIFHYKNFSISLVLYRYNMESDGVPLIYLIHEGGTEITHDVVWNISCKKVPKLASAGNICLLTNGKAALAEHSERMLATTSFYTMIGRLKTWHENPCHSVWELQHAANQLHRLSQHYQNLGENDIPSKKRSKHPIEVSFSGLLGLATYDQLEFSMTPEPEELPELFSRVSTTTKESKNNNMQPATVMNTLVRDAKKLVQQGLVEYDSETGIFLVTGSSVRTVQLFPEEKCSCYSSSICQHILACRCAIGIPLPSTSKIEIRKINNMRLSTRKYIISCKKRKRPPENPDSGAIVIEISPSNPDDSGPLHSDVESCLPMTDVSNQITVELV